MIQAVNGIKSPSKERETIYGLMDELGIAYRRTNCHKCLADYLAIIKEQLGLIGSAAELSEFNDDTEYEYEYIKGRAVAWNGHIMNQDTPKEIVEEFCRLTGDRYYRRVPVSNDTNNED